MIWQQAVANSANPFRAKKCQYYLVNHTEIAYVFVGQQQKRVNRVSI